MPRLGPPIRALLMRHDLLFSVGGDLYTLSLPDDVDPMPSGLTVVHLDVNPWELGKNYPDRKSTRLNSSHSQISYAVLCLKKKNHVRPPAQNLLEHDLDLHAGHDCKPGGVIYDYKRVVDALPSVEREDVDRRHCILRAGIR